MRRDSGEEVELDEAGKLTRCDFIFLAQSFEEGEVDEGRSRDADADSFRG